MNFTCLCFDLKYSFKINCCNLLHILFNLSCIYIYQNLKLTWPPKVLTLTDWIVAKSPPNSWCESILCRRTLIDTAPSPLAARGINLRCCDLGTCTTTVRHTNYKNSLCWPALVCTHLTQVRDLGSVQETKLRRGQKLTKEEFISGEIQWILSTNIDNGHYC